MADVPGMIEVRCRDCARANVAAVVMLVPEHLATQTVEVGATWTGDMHACGRCPVCRKRWCVVVLRPAA